MAFPTGRIRIESKIANGVFFTARGHRLWIQAFWGDPIALTENGLSPLPGQPRGSKVLWGDAERAVFVSYEVEDEGGTAFDIRRVVVLDLAAT